MKVGILLALLYSFNSYASHDIKEINCLATAIYKESRGEDYKGQLAVASVTKNRLKDKKFPSTYCKVVYQPFQYSWTSKNIEVDKSSMAWQTAKEIAVIVYYLDVPDPTHGALYFHSGKDKPYWTKKFKKTTKIKGHTFYKPVVTKT